MGLLTKEESERAWNRLLRHRGGPIMLGMTSNACDGTGSGSVVHMAKGLDGFAPEMRALGYDKMAWITERAVSMIRHRIFVDRKEVEEFMNRNLKQNQG